MPPERPLCQCLPTSARARRPNGEPYTSRCHPGAKAKCRPTPRNSQFFKPVEAEDIPSKSALPDETSPGLIERVQNFVVGVGSVMTQSPPDSTWHLSAHIGGVSVEFLVDSGANPNLLCMEVFRKLPQEIRARLQPAKTKLMAANDRLIATHGEIELSFSLQGQIFQEVFIVADLGPLQGILGMRFLRGANAYMGFREGVLCCGELRLQLKPSKSPAVFSVKLSEQVSIPAEHCVVVKAVVDSGLFTFPAGPSLAFLECQEGLIGGDGVVAPRSIVSVSCDEGRNVVDLVLTNFTDQPQELEAGVMVAKLEPIEPAQLMQHCSKVSEEPVREIPQHLEELAKAAATHLDAEQHQQVNELLIRFASTFAGPDGQLGNTDLVTHSIDTQGAVPIKCRYRPPGHAMRKVVDENLDKMLEMGVIEPIVSPWSSPIVLVRKKDGSIRFCVDLRRVNAVTRKDAYPLPNIGDCLGSLAGSEWFCTLAWQLATGRLLWPLRT